MNAIDSTFYNCLVDTITIKKNWRIALIGEEVSPVGRVYSSIKNKLVRSRGLHPRNIKIFSDRNPFRVCDAAQYDLLLGCRPCDAERTILSAATLFEKRFFIMPCACHCLQRKIVDYIREYPVIRRIEAHINPVAGTDPNFRRWAWMFLYN